MKNSHHGCIICGQVLAHRRRLAADNARKMRAVYAACLTATQALIRHGLTKQEPPSLAGLKGPTDPRQMSADGMAASAKCYRTCA